MSRLLHPVYVPTIGTGTPLRDVLSAAAKRDRFEIIGLKGGSLAHMLVRYQAEHHAPIVLVTPDEKHARHHALDLCHHLNAELELPAEQVLSFPPFDTGPYSELAAERFYAMERAGTLFKLARDDTWRFLVVSLGSLVRRFVPKNVFLDASMQLQCGQRLNRDGLIDCLILGKYYRTSLVEEPGTFAARGGLIDVFPPYLTAPLRIDFFGAEIDNIRTFDPETQKSGASHAAVWIHPAQLNFRPRDPDSASAIAARLRAICDQVSQPTSKTSRLLDDILEDRPILGIDRFAPAFYENRDVLFDYLPDSAIICLDDPDAIDAVHRKSFLSLKQTYERHMREGIPAFPPKDHCLTPAELERLLDGRQTIRSRALPVIAEETLLPSESGRALDVNAEDTEALFERLRTQVLNEKSFELFTYFAKYLVKLTRRGYRTAVVTHTTGQASRLGTMLNTHGVTLHPGRSPSRLKRPGVIVTSGELSKGCILPADGLAWIAEEEVFGRRTRRTAHRRAQPKATLSDLTHLNPGDLVVHSEHGIGKYEGLIRQSVRAAEMEFLLITYRDGDKLYLPVYRLNQIQKYRGGGPEQRLDKLGGQTFAQAMAKAKKATEEMAAKLLDLYAKRSVARRPPFTADDEMYREFEAAFPFEETDEQARAIDETMADLSGDTPMDRLVCGDVGFGKTEVAMRAAFRAAVSGFQTAILVPTTVLAQQHYQTFTERFAPYPVNIDMLSRFRSPKANRATVLAIKEGRCDIVIGTHRLLSKDVHFKRIGLLIIDEEHRFGVAHKERIRSLRASVDTLVLTATPIPRTLQMAFGGIRTLSLITTAPEARRPIKTMLCHDDPGVIRDAVTKELDRGGQVFFVHNRVHDIYTVEERLRKMVPNARIAVGHGQMKESVLERVMLDFVAGKYDILVCTAIIESGLDIPRANTIIIDRADTFGMAQLYQLRGRVGRSSKQAYAYLIVPPVAALTDDAKERVETLTRHTDLGSGFSIATMDLELRGAGNLIGSEQSGNVAAVGLEMFVELLENATKTLRGEPIVKEIDPELTLDTPGFLPETYIPDIGQRLHLYKQLASAISEQEVQQIAAELLDRFGALPEAAESLITGMEAKAICRRLRISGLEVNAKNMNLHLTPDTHISPDAIVHLIRTSDGRVKLTPELQVKVHFGISEPGGAIGAIHFLHRLEAYDNNLSIS